MRLDLLLPKLRARGVVLAAKGSNLTIQRGSALIRHDERAWLRANRSAVIAAVSNHGRGDPDLRGLLKRWHAAIGRSSDQFLWAFHRATGCDCNARTPTAEEMRVFDAMLDNLEPQLIASPAAPDCVPKEHGRLATSTPAREQHQEACA